MTSKKFHVYDFDRIINRKGTNSYKWDSVECEEALWVADMDFETAPCVIEAMKARMEHGCFGYTHVPESYYEAVQWWFGHRHGWTPKREHFIYTSGVVPAISAIIKAMTMNVNVDVDVNKFDTGKVKVMTHVPAYNCFFSSIRNNGCEVAPLHLPRGGEPVITESLPSGRFRGGYEGLLLLCNPHNPTGHVWRKSELEEISEYCHEHHIFVISDEIHCEFVNPDVDVRYTPFATVAKDDNYAVCISPSKAFNIAGLQIANIICPNDEIRQRIDKAININEVCDVNPFGVIALQAAYTPKGEEWLTQLNRYIYDNYAYVRDYIIRYIPTWKVSPLEGTYLMWIDIRETGMKADALCDKILKECNVCLSPGTIYGDENYIRLNLATQRARLKDALEKISKIVK